MLGKLIMGEKRRDALLLCAQGKKLCCDFLTSLKDEHNVNSEEYKGNNAKKLIAAVSEVFQELNQKQVEALWNGLSKLSFEALGSIGKAFGHENQDQANEMETDDASSVEVLEMICVLLLATVGLEEVVITQDVIQILKWLHGSLFDLHEIKPTLASCICTVCIKWWSKEMSSRECLCLNVVTLLLRLFFQGDKHGKLPSIYALQGCLSLFDFKRPQFLSHPSEEADTSELRYACGVVEELREMLIKCFQHPKILSDTAGRKFLSSVMLLHKDLMKDSHQVTMDGIGHKFLQVKAEALGNVYFLSWRTAEQEIKDAFEEICIQELMFRAVHAPNAKDQNLFLPLHTMLSSIVCHKGSVEVRHMITRLYSPILWRSLKANNAMVRANASSLLLDAFPLEEDNCGQTRVAENEEFMQRQYDALDNMLTDNCPRIRVIGIIGLCNVLHMYWDAVPAHVIAILTRKLYNDLAFDAVVEVRQAVFKGTITLLDTPCAHPLLSKLLPPCMEKCLHDVSEKVRIAAAEVLLAVKQTSTISFWSVCPIPNIIAQLEIDGVPVSKRLVKLLFRSFVPEDKPVEAWVERCVNFFKRDVNAARKFYSLVDKDLNVQEIGNFLHMIGVFLYNFVSRTLQQANSSLAESDMSLSGASNVDVSQMSDSSIDGEVLSALLDTSCILWRSLDRRVSEKNRETMKKIMITFSRTIHVCFKVANDDRTLNALLVLSSNLPPASLPVFSKSILPKLRSLPDDAPLSYYGMLIKCICAWDWTKRFLGLVYEWLVEATAEFKNDKSTINEETDATSGQKREQASRPKRSSRLSKSSVQKENDALKVATKSKKKVVTFTGVQHERRPGQALKYLEAFLEVQANCSFSALDNEPCLDLLLKISKSMEKCQDEILKRSLSSNSYESGSWSDALLAEAISIRCKLITVMYLHQRNESSGETCEKIHSLSTNEFKSFIAWFGDVVTQRQPTTKADMNTSVFTNESTAVTLLSRLSFSRQIFTSSLCAFLDFLTCGIAVSNEVEEALVRFCVSDTNLSEYTALLAKILFQLDEQNILKTHSHKSSFWQEECDEKPNIRMLTVFDSLISALLQHARRTPDGFMQLFRQEIRQPLRNVVKQQHLEYCIYPDQAWYSVLVRKTISAVLADLFHETRASKHVVSCARVSDLPAFSASILPVICATASETSYVCENAVLPLAGEESSENREQMLPAFALLLHTLCQDGKNKQMAEECVTTLAQDLPGFRAIFDRLKNGQTFDPSGTEYSEVTPNEDEKNDEREEDRILILENPNQVDMFVNDEEFVL